MSGVPDLVRMVSLYQYESRLVIQSTAFYRMWATDPEGYFAVVEDSIGDEALGEASRAALGACRIVPMHLVREFFDRTAARARFEARLADILHKVGAKGRKDFFKKARYCTIEQESESAPIVGSPFIRHGAEGWEPVLPRNERLFCAANSDNLELAKLVRNTMLASSSRN